MGRPLRILVPSTVHFVTTRCDGARFLLRPDPELRALVGLWLARAAHRFTGIDIQGVVVMSNHLHMLLVDRDSQLSTFMEFFLGQLARAINQMRHRRGHVFERRFSSEPVLDEEARDARLLYLVLNPVKAALVEDPSAWPGLLLWASSGVQVSETFRWFNQRRYAKARRTAQRDSQDPPSPADFYETETLVVNPLPGNGSPENDSSRADLLREELRRGVFAFAEQRRSEQKRCLGAERVLCVDPESSPKRPAWKRRPLCHASTVAAVDGFRCLMRALRAAYVSASAAFRGGDFTIQFPPYVFRPPGTLVPAG